MYNRDSIQNKLNDIIKCNVFANKALLTYFQTVFSVNCDNAHVLQKIVRSVFPFIHQARPTDKPKATINILCSTLDRKVSRFLKENGECIPVDTSFYAETCSNGRRIDFDSFHCIYIEKTESTIIISLERRSIWVLNPAPAQV